VDPLNPPGVGFPLLLINGNPFEGCEGSRSRDDEIHKLKIDVVIS